MKKILLVAALLVGVSAGAFAGPLGLDAIGVQWKSYNNFGGYSGGLTLLWDPINVGLGFWAGSWGADLDLSVDWWAYKMNLVSIINLYAFPGFYLGARVGGTANMNFGLRLGVGIQFKPLFIDPLEFFIEPALGVGILNLSPFSVGFSPHFQLAMGFRWYF